jgi:hypothetical protein
MLRLRANINIPIDSIPILCGITRFEEVVEDDGIDRRGEVRGVNT